MGGLATLFKKLGAEHGIEIDDDELESFGLDDDGARALAGLSQEEVVDAMGDVLSGEAAGAVEIFLSEPRTWLAGDVVEKDGLMWEPIIREGQWAVRPGPSGTKRRRPLRVVAGHSTDQRKEIGLADLIDAFNHPAIEHVTVPTSHQNDVTQNTGFIKGLKLADGKYKPKGSKTEKKVKVLMGGYDIKLPDIKKKMELGAIASRSAGLLYDYVDTETGKTWPVVLEHVALTNKPWITGMAAFGRKLAKKVKSTVGLSLSDDEPLDDDLLAADDALESIELADTSITWDKNDDPDWLRSRVNMQLDEARAAKIATLKAQAKPGMYVADYYDYPPRYRCVKARPGLALVADGWGDEANCWTAPFKVVDGDVELETDLTKWTASKRVYIPDDARKMFDAGEEPLDDEQETAESVQLTPLELAQAARKARSGGEPTQDNNDHPRGGEHMAGENGGAATLQLSEEARKLVEQAQKTAADALAEAQKYKGQVEGLLSGARETQADKAVAKLKGMGIDEQHGFSGALARIRELVLADDGQPAVQAECFANETNKEGTLSLSQALMSVFEAIELSKDGKVKLGTQLAEPSDSAEELGDGKPKKSEPKERSFDELSEAEQTADLFVDNPELFPGGLDKLADDVKAAVIKIREQRAANSNGNGGGE